MEDIRDGMTPGGEETGTSAAAGGGMPAELPVETPGFGACKDEETAAAVTPYPETGRGELATEDAETPESATEGATVPAEGAEGETAPAEGETAPAAKKENALVRFLKSVLGIGQPGDRVPGGEKFGYYFYFTGQNLIYAFVSTYLSAFALMRGLDPGEMAAVLLVVKIWDAVNDGIFGAIFDKVRFKSGEKFMPWLKMSVVLIPLSVIFLFSMPANISNAGKLAWLAVAYVIHDTVYTLCDAPLHGSATALTDNFGEREKMLSVKSIFGTAGGGITGLLVMVLISSAVGMSYTWVAVIGSVMAFVMMLPFCFKGKERTTLNAPEQEFTLKKMFKYLFSNKYLLIYYTAFLFSSGCGVFGQLQMFMSFYIFDSELVVLYTGLITTIPYAVASFAVPYIIKKVNKITMYRVCLLCSIGVNLLIFFFARGNVGAYMGLSVLNTLFTAVTGVLLFMFTPDCAEYGRFKTGTDAKGITFSMQTLMAKVGSAIAGSLGLALLALFGWNEITADSFKELKELYDMGQAYQSAQAIDGLWFTSIVVPLIGNFIAVLILQFYKLKDKDVALMMRCNAGEISREEAEAGITCKL